MSHSSCSDIDDKKSSRASLASGESAKSLDTGFNFVNPAMKEDEARAIMIPSSLIPQFINSKAYFMKTSEETPGRSTYDHLIDLLRKILLEKPLLAMESFEQLSRQVKFEKSRVTPVNIKRVDLRTFHFDCILEQWRYFKTLFGIDKFHRAPDPAISISHMSFGLLSEISLSVASESMIENCLISPPLPDILEFFNKVGLGMAQEEIIKLYISIENFANPRFFESVRFWGKIFGIKADYYILEAKVRDDISKQLLVESSTGKTSAREEICKPEVEIAVEEIAEDIASREIKEESKIKESEVIDSAALFESRVKGDSKTDIKETAEAGEEERFSLKFVESGDYADSCIHDKMERIVKPEASGEGTNTFTYFVSNDCCKRWKPLPDIWPKQLVKARLFKYVFTGDLDTKVNSYPNFPWKENVLLRAQISRISAATILSPEGLYMSPPEKDEEIEEEEGIAEEFEEEKPKINMDSWKYVDIGRNAYILKNRHFVLTADKEKLMSSDYWVHERANILAQGRCTWVKPVFPRPARSRPSSAESEIVLSFKLDNSVAKEYFSKTYSRAESNTSYDEYYREEESYLPVDSNFFAPESGPSLFTSIFHDEAGTLYDVWTFYKMVIYTNDEFMMMLKNNTWSGAHLLTNGKSYFNIYLGFGIKNFRDYLVSMPRHPAEECFDYIAQEAEPSLDDQILVRDYWLRMAQKVKQDEWDFGEGVDESQACSEGDNGDKNEEE